MLQNFQKIASVQDISRALDQCQARILFKPDGSIVEANDNFLKALGYTAEEIVGKHHRMFCEDVYTSSPAYQKFWEDLRAGKAQCGSFKRIKRSGEPIYIQASYSPVRNKAGKVIAVVKYAVDISIPTTRLNDALARTQAVISFSLDGRITDVNATFLSALGYARGDVIGQHHRMFCDKEYVASPQYADFWQRLNRGEPQVGEFERIRSDGRPIYIQAAYNPTFDLDGTVTGVTKYATDITQAKDLKREADSMAISTSAAVEEMTASISDIARSMTMTRDSVEEASKSAHSVLGMVGDLLAAGEKMSSVVTLIQSISEQINLLSLNAAIEAARAGDAGRGFAVVADEVKKLASHASQSTSTITEEIRSVQSLSGQISGNVEQMSAMIGHVKEGATTVAAATEEQSAVVNDIAKQVNALTDLVARI